MKRRIGPCAGNEPGAVFGRRAGHSFDDRTLLGRRVHATFDQQFAQREADECALGGGLGMIRLKRSVMVMVVIVAMIVVTAHSTASSQCSKISMSSVSSGEPA